MSVESIDDKEDMQFADEAFDILGFTKEEKYNVYKVRNFETSVWDVSDYDDLIWKERLGKCLFVIKVICNVHEEDFF